jgi:hypothetical protein
MDQMLTSRDSTALGGDFGQVAPACRRPIRLIDVGSTVIKALRLEEDGSLTNFDRLRIPGQSIAAQVHGTLAAMGPAPRTMICSSANGGLRIGVLGLSRRYSGGVAVRMLEAVGANIAYHLDWRAATEIATTQPPVDMLVVVGGIDSHSATSVRRALPALKLGYFPHDRLVYAGHRGAASEVKRLWPSAHVEPNLLQDGLAPSGTALTDYARLTYLDDIESKRDIVPLQRDSAVPIEPTPGVVSRAFQRLYQRLASPAILLDVGGATTDLHFTKELLDEDNVSGPLSGYPDVGRHVFTAYGVAESRASTVRALAGDARCVDFLSALWGADFRRVYVDLIDGHTDDRTAFAACIFLALRQVSDARVDVNAPRLLLPRLATLALTGGASQALAAADIQKAAEVVLQRTGTLQVVLDSQYRWWSLGLLDEAAINERTLQDLHA